MTHGPCLYVLKLFICKKGFLSLTLLIFIMRPKVQLIPLDVDYQRKERAKARARLDKLKKPRVIPREKPLANFSFKLVAFDLPPSPQSVPSTSKVSPLEFERFIGRNHFDFRTNPSTFYTLLPYFSFSFPFLSNPFMAENPCYKFSSSSPSLLDLKSPRPSPKMSQRLSSALLKATSAAEPVVIAPSSTARFDFFGHPPRPELTSYTGE